MAACSAFSSSSASSSSCLRVVGWTEGVSWLCVSCATGTLCLQTAPSTVAHTTTGCDAFHHACRPGQHSCGYTQKHKATDKHNSLPQLVQSARPLSNLVCPLPPMHQLVSGHGVCQPTAGGVRCPALCCAVLMVVLFAPPQCTSTRTRMSHSTEQYIGQQAKIYLHNKWHFVVSHRQVSHS